jgi:Prephenate dehydrogenase
MDRCTFAVIGGDARQAALSNMLAAEGITVYCSGFEQAAELLTGTASTDPITAALMADVIILPMPPTRDGTTLTAPLSTYQINLDEAFCGALSGKAVFAGIAQKLRAVSPSYAQLDVYDYCASDSFLIRNAQATAEGALAELISKYPRTICGSSHLITGCGRITGFLAPMLRALGGKVTVAARKPSDRARMLSLGIDALTFNKALRKAKDFDVIINTVPASVIDRRFVDAISPETFLIDLASSPGGIDLEACGRRKIKPLQAPGLPGQYSPVTAAEIIKDTVMSILEEEQEYGGYKGY